MGLIEDFPYHEIEDFPYQEISDSHQ